MIERAFFVAYPKHIVKKSTCPFKVFLHACFVVTHDRKKPMTTLVSNAVVKNMNSTKKKTSHS